MRKPIRSACRPATSSTRLTLRFTYSSMTTPAETYDYDMATRTRVLRKRQEIPSGHNPADYVTRRLFAPAPDGETVPVSILYRRDTPLDGSAPLFLYGYGAYGISIPASFSTTRLSLVDRGVIYAIAHIRGGKDKGYRWYTEGKLEQKVNTFTDFIAAGEHLGRQGLYAARPHRRQRRFRGWHADGCRRQHGSRSLPRHHCRRALRRRPEHDARQGPARSRRPSGPSGATPSRASASSRSSSPTAPTTTCGPWPIRTSSPMAA